MNNVISFDSMIQMAAKEFVYRQLDAFPSPKELEKMYTYSKPHENKMNKLIKKENRFDKFVEFNRKFSKVAVILLLTLTVTLTPLISAKAVRESIVETIIEWKEDFASIFFKSENTPVVINKVKIKYMVDGFVSSGAAFQDAYTHKEFFYSTNQHINVEIHSKYTDTTSYIDNEYSDYYAIIINNNDGIWIYRNNFSKLIIYDNNFVYCIDGNVDIGELINIYKNIEIF